MSLNCFWWSPVRSLRLARYEIADDLPTWARLTAQYRRLPQNFGDELTPVIVEALTGQKVKWTMPERADLVAVGSIIEVVLPKRGAANFWGSGLRHEFQSSLSENDKARFLAVRGPKTRVSLGLSRDLPIGDPGIFANELIGRAPGRSGHSFLPHYRTWRTKSGREEISMARSLGFRIIAPNDYPKSVCTQIAQSESVVTSSLHGAIVAGAVGTPVVMTATADATLAEPDFKYSDYFASIGVEPVFASRVEWLDGRRRKSAVEKASDNVSSTLEAIEILKPAMRQALVSAI